MKSKFKTLVRDLDQPALDELQRSVTAEMESRRSKIHMEQIHPRMSESDRAQAAQEITRVLNGGENA